MKFLFKVILFTSIVLLFIYFLELVYTSNRWRKYYTTDELLNYKRIIKSCKKLPFRFYNIYDSLHVGCRHKTMFNSYNAFIIRSEENCFSFYQKIYFALPAQLNEKNIEYPSWCLGWALSTVLSPEECFDYYYNNILIDGGNFTVIGVDKASLRFFKKDLSSLSDSEIIKLINIIG